MNDQAYMLHQGSRPLVLSLPHCGTHIPTDEQQRYEPRALGFEDTDWHLAELYAFAAELGATDTILATDPDAVRLIRERTGGGVDVAVEPESGVHDLHGTREVLPARDDRNANL